MATKCFHLKHNGVLLMEGRSRSNLVKEITPQVPSLDPPFVILSIYVRVIFKL